MHPVIRNSFGGLTPKYYFRQLLFGLILTAGSFLMLSQNKLPVPVYIQAIIILNAFLYPYSRFVYERFVDFIMGDNVLYVKTSFALIVKLFTMSLCLGFALILAPIGLIWLYLHHTRAIQKKMVRAQEGGLE